MHHTYRACASVQAVLYKLFDNGAQVNYDLSRLDLVDLNNSQSAAFISGRLAHAHRAALNGLDRGHLNPWLVLFPQRVGVAWTGICARRAVAMSRGRQHGLAA